MIISNHSQTPDFTFKVGLHQSLSISLGTSIQNILELHDWAIAEADKQISLVKVDRLGNGKSGGF